MRPSTQLEAWDALQDSVEGKRLRVLSTIKSKRNGLTLFEICNNLKWPVNRVSGRVTELRKKGLIVDSGQRRINPSSGKNGIVWVYKNESSKN